MADKPVSSSHEEPVESSDVDKDALYSEPEQVEGTVRLFRSDGAIRKIPVPSNDPADPLTWSTWKRGLVLLCLCVYGTAGFGVIQSTPLFFSQIIPEYKKQTRGRFNAALIAQLASYPSLCMGIGNFLFVPLSMMLGRRAIFLFNNCLMLASIIWAAKSHGFEAHLAARCLQGLTCGISDCLLPIMILDMTFLHRRGLWMSFYWAVTAAGSAALLVPLPFAVRHAPSPWRTNYWFWSAFAAFSLVVGIFRLPETLYPREPALVDGQVIITDSYGHVKIIAVEDAPEYLVQTAEAAPKEMKSGTFLSRRKLFKYQPNGFRRFYMTYVEMAVSFINPSIFYVLILNTFLFSGLVATSITYAEQLERGWHFSVSAVGTAQAGAFFGALIALAISGTTSDKVSKFLTRRNNGIREPEHILPNFILPSLLAFAGLVLYGCVAGSPEKHPGAGWVGVHFAFGLYMCGFVALSAVTGVWVGEATPHYSGAALVLVCGGRNALSFPINDNIALWAKTKGIQNCYIELGSALLGTMIVGGIPLYFLNKRIRRFWTKKMKFNWR